MALSAATSETSVSGLLGERSPQWQPDRRLPQDVRSWAEHDSVEAAAAACSSPSDTECDDRGSGAAALRLRLDVAAGQLVRPGGHSGLCFAMLHAPSAGLCNNTAFQLLHCASAHPSSLRRCHRVAERCAGAGEHTRGGGS